MELIQQKTPLSTNENEIATYNYSLKDKDQNNYKLNLIIYNQKISFEVKQSSDILNQVYKSEIELKDLSQMCQKVFGAYNNMQEINEDFFKFLKEENFIVTKIDNKIGIEMIIPQGFKKVNLHFDLNLIQNKIEDDFLNLLNNFNEFKKYATEEINLLKKANSEKDIIIENLSKEIKNLRRMHLISDNKGIHCIKTFEYPKKIIYCLKVDVKLLFRII